MRRRIGRLRPGRVLGYLVKSKVEAYGSEGEAKDKER